jgi:nucleoid DNA-binding protein
MKVQFGELIAREKFIQYVSERLDGAIGKDHIRAVISLFLDDLTDFISEGNTIEVDNLGTICLKKQPARKHHDINSRNFKQAEGNNQICFKIGWTLRRFLAKQLDTEKTFGEEFQERKTPTEGIDPNTNPFWLHKHKPIDQ